jgi:hypothetical protein
MTHESGEAMRRMEISDIGMPMSPVEALVDSDLRISAS